jgi:hypothetical protein
MAIPPFPASQFDANQVLKYSFDDATGTLRTTATATVVSGDITIESSHTSDSMRLGDGTNYIGSVTDSGQNGLSVNVNNSNLQVFGPLTDAELRATPVDVNFASPVTVNAVNFDIRDLVFATDKVDVSGSVVDAIQSGVWNITNITGIISLPTGASTSALQTAGNLSLSNIDTSLDVALSTRASEATLSNIDSNIITVDTDNVTVVSSVLPTGASTSALQTAGNASLVSIDSKLTAPLSVIGPLTDTELRATPVPVSGTLTVTGTDIDIRDLTFATDKVDVSGSTVDAVQSGTWNINDITGTISLPTGASTSALQVTGNASLASIDSKLTAPLSVVGPLTDTELRATPVPISGTVTANLGTIADVATETTLSNLDGKVVTVDTDDVTITSSVLPTGAATSALQTTGNASLASIDSKLTAPLVVSSTDLDIRDLVFATDKVDVSGSSITVNNAAGASAVNIQDGGNSITVDGTINAVQSGTWNINDITGTVSLPTGAATSALQTTGNSSLASIDGKLNSLGQKTMANSVPVVIASDQTVIPISDNGGSLTIDGTVAISNSVSPTERATFSAIAEAIDIANGKSMISLLNDSGSGVTIKITKMYLINTRTTATTGVIAEFQLRRFTGHSGGTLITTDAYDTNDVLNGSVTVRTGATIAGEVTRDLRRWLWSSDEWGTGSTDVESDDHVNQSLVPSFEQSMICKPLVLNSGQGLHIRQNTNSNNGTFDLVIEFTQE